MNGKQIESTAKTIVDLLDEQGLDPTQNGIAVALNNAVIVRSNWNAQNLSAGDTIEIITAMQGG